MALFRVDFSGRGELSERQQKVGVCTVYMILKQEYLQLQYYSLLR